MGDGLATRCRGKVQAAVETSMNQGHVHEAQLAFTCSRDSAFFRLRILAIPEDTYVYFLLSPEQIVSLTFDQASTNDKVAQACRTTRGTTCLRFTLNRPASLLGPHTWPSLEHQVDARVLSLLRSLTLQTTFAIHIPGDSDLQPRLTDLCLALSTMTLISDHQLANISMLYQGKGAADIKFAPETGDDAGDDAGLPSYNKHGAFPSDELQTSIKRRRVSADMSPPSYEEYDALPPSKKLKSPGAGGKRRRNDVDEDEDQRGWSICTKLFLAEMEKMEARMVDVLTHKLKEVEDRLADRLADIEKRVSDEVEKAETDAREYCTFYVDDTLTGIKLELEDFIQEEMVNVEERVVDSMQHVTWSGNFWRTDV